MTQVKRRKGWKMSSDVGEVMERLENEHNSHTHTAELILQPFFRFSYVTGFSLTLPGGQEVLDLIVLLTLNTSRPQQWPEDPESLISTMLK